MRLVKIQDKFDLARDITSGAVINTNTNEYEKYISRRKSNLEFKDQIKKNSEEIKELKSDVAEIKQLLISLINKEQ